MSNNEHDPTTAITFPQLIRGAAASYGDETAITYRRQGQPEDARSFNNLERESAEIARGLIARGVSKGTRIGFIYGNHPDFAVIFAAIARAGGIAIPISTMLKANELVRVLRQSDVTGIIVQRHVLNNDMVSRVMEALPELNDSKQAEFFLKQTPFLRWIVSSGDSLPPAIRDLRWIREAADIVSADFLQELESEIHPTDQLLEIYTSGSMALPKGVKHNHGPVMDRSHFIRSMTPAAVRGAELTARLPMFWVGGMGMYLLANWEIGALTVCTDELLQNSRIAMGSVLNDDDLQAMRSSDMTTYWALGMTETFGPYSYGDELRAAGYPLCTPLDHIADKFEVRVADEAGNECKEDEIGEIQVRGYALTPGLHKLERSGYFTPDGFYHTGDMGFRTGQRILFVGRDGDMIKSAGANVSPAEVELEMQQLDGVHSAYVVGIPDKQRGQLVVAAVVPREDATPDFDAIEKTLRQRLSGFKVPRAYFALSREEVPMLPSNKVHRRQIEKIAAERLGRS